MNIITKIAKGIITESLLNENLMDDIELPTEVQQMIDNLNLTYDIQYKNYAIYSSNDSRLLIKVGTTKMTSDELLYIRFCKANPSTTSDMDYMKSESSSSINLMRNTKTKEWVHSICLLEYNYSSYNNKEVISDIRDYFNSKFFDAQEREFNPLAIKFIDAIKFDGFPLDRIILDNTTIKVRNEDNSLILVNCFGESVKRVGIKDYKESLKDQGMPEKLISFLEDNGFSLEGSGVYASVYSKPGHNIVLKVTTNLTYIDEGYLSFVDFCNSHNSIHLPKVGKVRKFGEYFVLPIEKLKSGSSRDFTNAVAEIRDYLKEESLDLDLPSQYESQAQGIKQICDELKGHLKSEFHMDIHQGNIMLRGSTLVITDPIAMN